MVEYIADIPICAPSAERSLGLMRSQYRVGQISLTSIVIKICIRDYHRKKHTCSKLLV